VLTHPRTILRALAALAALALIAPATGAAVEASALRRADVVIERGAASDVEEAGLLGAAERLRDAGAPTKFVVLAERPQSSVAEARRLRRLVGARWTVLVLAPSTLGIAAGVPEDVIEEVFREQRPLLEADRIDGTIAVADDLADARTGAAEDPDDSGGLPGWVWLAAIGGIVGLLVLRRLSRRRQAWRAASERRAALEPLVDALAAQVNDLEADGPAAAADPATRADREEAVLAYGDARDGMRGARDRAGIARVRATLERGLRAAHRAQARRQGRPVEEAESAALLEGLCAFDPKHGLATTVAPVPGPATGEADLPVCEACAASLAVGREPEVRSVPRGGRRVPYWQGTGMGDGVVPFAAGAFGSLLLLDVLTPEQASADPGGDSWGGGDFGGGGDF